MDGWTYEEMEVKDTIVDGTAAVNDKLDGGLFGGTRILLLHKKIKKNSLVAYGNNDGH